MKATALRSNLFRILDEILRTGEPVEIERKGKTLQIAPKGRGRNRLDALEPHGDVLDGDPDSIIHLDWSSGWKP